MNRVYNEVGSYCIDAILGYCEHNMADSGTTPMFKCSGHCGKCFEGDAFSYFERGLKQSISREEALARYANSELSICQGVD